MKTKELLAQYPESFLLQYIQEIESGNIIIGRELRMMLEKLKSSCEDDRYRYDSSEPLRRINFIEKE